MTGFGRIAEPRLRNVLRAGRVELCMEKQTAGNGAGDSYRDCDYCDDPAGEVTDGQCLDCYLLIKSVNAGFPV